MILRRKFRSFRNILFGEIICNLEKIAGILKNVLSTVVNLRGPHRLELWKESPAVRC